MLLAKVQSINYVVFGNSHQKGTPYIKINMSTEHGKANWIGYYTQKSEPFLRKQLAALGFTGKISDVKEIEDKSSRSALFSVPPQGVMLEQKEFTNDEGESITYYNVVEIVGVQFGTTLQDEYDQDAWSNFDKNTKMGDTEGRTDVPF